MEAAIKCLVRRIVVTRVKLGPNSASCASKQDALAEHKS